MLPAIAGPGDGGGSSQPASTPTGTARKPTVTSTENATANGRRARRYAA